MEYKNLWNIPSKNPEINITDNIFTIMKQQCNYLKAATNNKISGKFCKIKRIDPLSTMAHVLHSISSKEVLQNNDTDNLKDANELYKSQKYGFEIYNTTYKFRIFEMIVDPIYPVHLIIDEGIVSNIADELFQYTKKENIENCYLIESDYTLLDCLQLIFSSKKVQFILYKMQQSTTTDAK